MLVENQMEEMSEHTWMDWCRKLASFDPQMSALERKDWLKCGTEIVPYFMPFQKALGRRPFIATGHSFSQKVPSIIALQNLQLCQFVALQLVDQLTVYGRSEDSWSSIDRKEICSL